MIKNIKSNNSDYLRLAVYFLSVTQFLTPFFSFFNENRNRNKFDPPITPAGYAFAVWGIITVLGFLYGIYQLIPNKKNTELHNNVSIALCIVYLLFTVWLVATSLNWLWTTVVIFSMMFFILKLLFEFILENKAKLTVTEKVILKAQIGIYLGWSTVAVFANMASALSFYGWDTTGTSGTLWQSIILLFALANSLRMINVTNSDYFLSSAILWAFIGVFFGLRNNLNTTFLQIFVVVSIATLIAYIIYLKYKNNSYE